MPRTSPPSPPEPHRPPLRGANPIPTGRYDLVVVGDGESARIAALDAVELGAHVALVRTGVPGGVDLGVDGGVDGAVDVYAGRAAFVAADAIHLEGRHLRFVCAILAPDAAATPPTFPGWTDSAVRTVDQAARGDWADKPPRRVAVAGADAEGCAIAQALARRGLRVALFAPGRRVLPREAPEAGAALAAALDADGVHVHYDQAAPTADEAGGFDAVVVATDRAVDVAAFGLAAAGVAVEDGRVRYDTRLATTNPRVYVAGDIALDPDARLGAPAIARLAVRNALFGGRGRCDLLTIPRCTTTVPPVAAVGLLPHEPEAAAVPLVTRREAFEPPDRLGSTGGFVEVHLAEGTDAMLGATVVGDDAAAVIGEIARAIDAGVGLGRLGAAARPAGAGAALDRLAAAEARGRRLPLARTTAALWLGARRALADRTTRGG